MNVSNSSSGNAGKGPSKSQRGAIQAHVSFERCRKQCSTVGRLFHHFVVKISPRQDEQITTKM
eukprot:6468941-Amphidinium_carterae.1